MLQYIYNTYHHIAAVPHEGKCSSSLHVVPFTNLDCFDASYSRQVRTIAAHGVMVVVLVVVGGVIYCINAVSRQGSKIGQGCDVLLCLQIYN